MQTTKAFILGMFEFRSQYTTSQKPELIKVYDMGREIAHRLTLRHFEQ